MQNIRIATLLKDKWELIVHSWAVEIRHTIDDYKTRPIDELLHTTGAHLDAIIELLETDSNAKLRKFMNNIAPLRMTQHFKLSDIQRAFLIGRRVILSLAEKEYGGNSEEFCAARAAIEEPFTLTLLEYSDIYQQLQVQEAEKRSTELHKAEEERRLLRQLNAEREKLDHLVAAIGADIAIIDRTMKIVWHNRYLSGGNETPIIKLGEKCDVLRWHQKGGCPDCATARAFKSGTTETANIEKRENDGTHHYYQIVATPLRSHDGRIRQVLETVREITDIRELERRMGTQQEFLEAIRNDSADAIIGLDEYRKIIFWNRGAETIFGYGAEEILQKPFQTLVPAEMIGNGQLRRIFSQVQNDDFVKNYEINLKAKNDREVPVDLTLTAIHDENDNHIGISAVIRDISERKNLEEKVLQTERLATVGRMAAKVAHDIRNPLSSISLNAELLDDEINTFSVKRTSEARSLLRSIASEVDRLTQISDEYLQFSRTPKMKFKLDDINLILSELIKLLSKELLSKKIRVIKRFSKLLPLLPLDKAQMHRAFLNLLRNAVEAMSKGGTIKLITRSDSEYVTIRIVDNGEGIAENELTKIFDPFHSTKEFGTGLGLTITRQIIEEHGGTIKCTSQRTEGTEFEVKLPLKKIKRGDLL